MADPILTSPPPPQPPPPPRPFVTSSRLGDRVLGIFLGFAWWGAGALLVALSARNSGTVFSLVAIAYIAQLFYLASLPRARALLLPLVLTTVLTPVLLILGVIGMCAGTHL